MNSLFMFGFRYRITLLLMLSVLTLLAAIGMQRLHIDTGAESMLTKGSAKQLMYEAVIEEFGSDNQTLIFVRDQDLWTYDKLQALKLLHTRLAELDVVQHVEDVFTLRSLRGKEGHISTQILMDHIPEQVAAIDQLKEDILYNPMVKGNLISSDGNALALMVTIQPEALKQLGHVKIYDAIEQLIAPSMQHFERLFQIGSPRIQTEMENTLFSDMRMLAPLSAGMILLVILLFMRSVAAGVIPLLTAAISLIWTLGMMGWAGIPINILSAMLPTLIIVIGSTEDTHLIASFLRERNQYPQRNAEFCVRKMLAKMGLPLLLTVLTTVLGFAGNIFSSMELIRDFALASSFAMLANGVVTILLVPMLLVMLAGSQAVVREKKRESSLSKLILKLNQKSNISMQRLLLTLTGLLCVFFLIEASKLHVTNDPMSYFKQDRPLIQDAREVNEHLAGIKTFFIRIQSHQEQAFLQPKNLRKMEAVELFIGEQKVFDSTVSLVGYLKLLNREFHAGDEHWYQLPGNKQMVSQYLLFLHRQELQRYVSHDYQRSLIVVRHHISDSSVLNRSVDELRQVAQEIVGAELQVDIVGENLMINEEADALLHAQIESLIIFLVIIFFLMSAMFTSFKGGFIAMVPSVIPIILMFGVMGMLNIPLNPGTAMVAIIAIGIAIDSTIHMLSSYNKHSRKMGDAVQAAQQAVRDEALPMITTSVALALGFGILLASDFAIIGQFGALAAATMLFSLFANLIVTPLIMSRVRLVGLYDILALSVDKEVLHGCQLFQGMSDYQIRKAMLISEIHDFHKGSKIITQGSLDRSMYLLIKGEVDVVHHSHDGDEVIARLNPGEVFGEIAFVREIRRTADVCAVSSVSVVRFDYERLKHDLRFFPRIVAKLNFNISYILGERLANTLKD